MIKRDCITINNNTKFSSNLSGFLELNEGIANEITVCTSVALIYKQEGHQIQYVLHNIKVSSSQVLPAR